MLVTIKMLKISLKTWKLCFLCVISIVLTVTTLIHQDGIYYTLKAHVMMAYPDMNTSRHVTDNPFRRLNNVDSDVSEEDNVVANSNRTEYYGDIFMPETIGAETQQINPHPYMFIINYPNFCLQHEELVLLIAVISAVRHFEERQAVRETWGGYARKFGAKLLFFLGEDSDPSVNQKARDESRDFQDVIQENFKDSYLNLTLKSVSIVKWVSMHCPRVKWVLKIDEDNLLNVDHLMQFLRNNTLKMSMFGMLAHNWLPNRSIYSKWYASREQFPGNVYPDFLAGPAYLLTGDTAERLYQTSLYTKFFHLEDVYLTGIVAQRAGVKRYHLKGVTNSLQRITPCLFKSIINSHHHSARDLKRTWYITQMNFFVCLKDWFSS